jgi:26S proteasome regulatory subunit N10
MRSADLTLHSPEVLVTPTTNHGKILSALHQSKIGGSVDLATGLNVAQLALKHRQNKNQRQRIIVFLGSPLDTDEKSLVKLAKKLKKNNVAVDVISFGEEDINDSLLRTFVDTLNSSDNR